MIQEAYVSFEVARLLDEKGYKEPFTDYLYDEKGQRVGYVIPSKSYPCPTHQMAMAWLREKHNIHISVTIGCDADKDSVDCIFYWAGIAKFNNVSGIDYIDPFDDKEFSSNEEAVEAALKYCLEEVI